MRAVCDGPGGLMGPWVVSSWRSLGRVCGPGRLFLTRPGRVCSGLCSGRCLGLCRCAGLLGPGPRSVCVSPRSGPCVFEQYLY